MDARAKFIEHGCNVDVRLAATLEKGYAQLIGQLLALARLHSPQRSIAITLVAHQYFHGRRGCILANVLEPILDVLKGFVIGYIVHHNDALELVKILF